MEEKYIQIITETAERAKSNSHRIEEMGVKIDKLSEQNIAIIEMGNSFKLLNQEMRHLREDTDKNFTSVKEDFTELSTTVKQTQKDVNDLKQEPSQKKAKFVDDIKWLIISGSVTGILGFVLGMVLK